MECQRSVVRLPNRRLYVKLKKILLYKSGVKYVLSTRARDVLWVVLAQQLDDDKADIATSKTSPKDENPKNVESLGRCNRPNTKSKGCLWLRCVLSGWSLWDSVVYISCFRRVAAKPDTHRAVLKEIS